MKKMTKRWLTGILSALSFCALGFGLRNAQTGETIGTVNAVAEGETEATATPTLVTTDEIVMETGGEIRTIIADGSLADKDKPSIRFSVKVSQDTFARMEKGEVRVGIMLTSESIVRKMESSGATDYYAYLKDKAGLRAEAGVEGLYKENGECYVRIALTDIQFANIDRTFMAIGYVHELATGERRYTTIDYSNARSVEWLASYALNSGNTWSIYDSETQKNHTPLIDWLNQAIYDKAGVTYNAADNTYVYEGVSYSYDELQARLNAENLAKERYAVPTMPLQNTLIVGETFSLYSDNHAELNMKYESAEEGVVSVNSSGLMKAEKAGTTTVYARVGDDSAGNYFSIPTTVRVLDQSIPSAADLDNPYEYDWTNRYMYISSSPDGSRASRVESWFNGKKSIAMKLLADQNWWFNGLGTINLQDGNYLYTVTLHIKASSGGLLYFVTDTTGDFDNENINQGENTVTFTYAGNAKAFGIRSTVDIELGKMSIKRVAYHGVGYANPSDAQLLQGYTWNFAENNFMQLDNGASYQNIYSITNNELRNKLINEGQYTQNYALRLNLSAGGTSIISLLAGKMTDDRAYKITFTGYAGTGGTLSMVRFGIQTDFINLTQNKVNEMRTYSSDWIHGDSTLYSNLGIYANEGTDIYISSITITMKTLTRQTLTYERMFYPSELFNGATGQNCSAAVWNSNPTGAGDGFYGSSLEVYMQSDAVYDLLITDNVFPNARREGYFHGGVISMHYYIPHGYSASTLYLYEIDSANPFIPLDYYSTAGSYYIAKNYDASAEKISIHLSGASAPNKQIYIGNVYVKCTYDVWA